MAGETLRTDSVDAGRSLALNDVGGRPLMQLSANDVARYHFYEPAPLAGRPVHVTEGALGETPRIAERFLWAGPDQVARAVTWPAHACGTSIPPVAWGPTTSH